MIQFFASVCACKGHTSMLHTEHCHTEATIFITYRGGYFISSVPPAKLGIFSIVFVWCVFVCVHLHVYLKDLYRTIRLIFTSDSHCFVPFSWYQRWVVWMSCGRMANSPMSCSMSSCHHTSSEALATGSAWMDGLSRLTHVVSTISAGDSLDQVSHLVSILRFGAIWKFLFLSFFGPDIKSNQIYEALVLTSNPLPNISQL